MNITVKQIEFKLQGDTIYGWLYTPATPVHGVVQIVHGMAEHMGRYHEFMRYLAQNGYAACGIDQLGHGRSARDKKQGFFAAQDGWKLLLESQLKFNKIIHSEIPGKGIVLFGHSMGSFVARVYAVRYPRTIQALMISGSGRGGLKIELGIQLANHSAQKHGADFTDLKLSEVAFGLYNERFRGEQGRHAWLSRDSSVGRRFEEDPLCDFVFTAAAFRDMFILIRKANEKECFESFPRELPLLVLAGALDPVGDYGRGVRWIYNQYIRGGTEDAQLMLYEGGRHEMLNEINREQVYSDLLAWIDARFAPFQD